MRKLKDALDELQVHIEEEEIELDPWERFQLAFAVRATSLLDWIRGLGVATLIIVFTLGLVGGAALNSWFQSQEQDIKKNRIVICDLYRQLKIDAPPSLDCATLLGEED